MLFWDKGKKKKIGIFFFLIFFTSRIYYTMARDGLLWPWIAKVKKKKNFQRRFFFFQGESPI